MNLKAQIRDLLNDIGPGRMASTAYDTAWVARLIELEEPVGYQALEWLRENQLPDGSWGASQPRYYHDRLICTLAAMAALSRWGNQKDKSRIERARLSMDIAMKGLRADPVGETVGFEMIVPTLLAELKASGVVQRYDDANFLRMVYPNAKYRLKAIEIDEQSRRRDDEYFKRLTHNRAMKIKSLPEGQIDRHVTMAFSAEMAGTDRVQLLDLENIQEPNGSVGYSPSATAYFALYGLRGDLAALNYLREVAERNRVYYGGGIPNVAPFDTFERSWSLWNLLLAGIDDELNELCEPHLDFIARVWEPEIGVGFTSIYKPTNSDDTSMAFKTMSLSGRLLDIDAVLGYEEKDHFRCFELESNPSISANIHVLGALLEAGLDGSDPSVVKIVKFLRQTRVLDTFWTDKWHASPYYPTSQIILVVASFLDDMIIDSVKWIIETQNNDGSWGYYMPTAEETAYCLQSLFTWQRYVGEVPKETIDKGLEWLLEHNQPPYPPLWIGKCLYNPELVVRSAVLSALMMGQKWI